LQDQKLALRNDFNSLYQGVPGNPEGTFFKTENLFKIDPRLFHKLAYAPILKATSWDLAWSDNNKADYTVGLNVTLYARKREEEIDKQHEIDPDVYKLPPLMILLETMWRWKKDINETQDDIVAVSKVNGKDRLVLLEAVAAQSTVVKSIKARKDLLLYDFIGIKPNKDKIERARYPRRLLDRGLIWYLALDGEPSPEWVSDFISEMNDFPLGAYDDQVDSLTQFINHVQELIDHILENYPEGVWVDAEGVGQLFNHNEGFRSAAPPELSEQREAVTEPGGWEWV
jgi:predicted phage terminase large subunit-like protein